MNLNRNFSGIIHICFLFVFLSACSSNNPKKVAEKFLVNVTRGDLDEAKKYCDSSTRELLDQAAYLKKIPDSMKAELRKLQINVLDAKENGDHAIVSYNTSKLKEKQMVSLVKVDNEWKVQLSKMAAEHDADEQPMLTEEPAVVDTLTAPKN